ncbi:MAG: Orotidine 5'-phosphate decarboxylase [Parcubacteria group bacterium GW2011_GWA2_42_11]|nr:MAG: Orotidine 5'-phosphate decarboxylase [Parcubacteria group bacterium GW2011_GWA2_42_11]
MPIIDKYNQRVDKVNSLLCVGLDADWEKLPAKFKALANPQFEFNKWIIEETVEFAAAYKPNAAFYEARGDKGLAELKMTMDWLRKEYSDVFTILDAKRADIGNTNRGYIEEIFDWLGFDAMTLHPYLGGEALAPFLARKDKGCIILCRTSNPGAGELQDLVCDGRPIWQAVAETVRDKWNKNDNCLLVVGATYPAETKKIRELTGNMTFLMPGIGAQGGEVKAAVEAGKNSEGKGLIINSARGIIFADDPAGEAKKLREEINKYR